MTRFLFLALMLVAVSCSRRPSTAAGGSPDYDAAREVVLNGTVKRIMEHLHEGPPVVHLIVAVNGRDVAVHVAPPWFLKQEGFELHTGDQVQIVGALQKDEPHYHARSVTRGSRTLTLRNAQGFPLWDQRRSE